MNDANPTAPQRENVARGVALAALVIPAAVLLWILMWSGGYFITVLLLLLAAGATLLYAKGAGGSMSILGASLVSILVVVGFLLGYFAGVLASVVGSMASILGVAWPSLLFNAGFWPPFFENLPRFMDESSSQLFLAALVSAGGVFFVFYLRAKVIRRRTPLAAPAAAPQEPIAQPTVTSWQPDLHLPD